MKGLVYVKKAVVHDEPFTFDPETTNPLEGAWRWAHVCFQCKPSDPLPQFPTLSVGLNKITYQQRSEARSRFLSQLNVAKHLSIEQWDDIVELLSHSLGEPWEDIKGFRMTPSLEGQSWLAGCFENIFTSVLQQGSLAWTLASVRRLNDPDIIKTLLPLSSALEPWQENKRTQWTYDLLDAWWKNQISHLRYKNQNVSPVQDPYASLIVAIDQKLEGLPQPMGLPFHWRLAARQAQSCIEPYNPNFISAMKDLDVLQPIHSCYNLSPQDPKSPKAFWMGKSEWQLARFSEVSRNLGWQPQIWDQVAEYIEKDIHQRGKEMNAFLDPFHQIAIQSIKKGCFTEDDKKRKVFNEVLFKQAQAALDRWWIRIQTPQVQQSVARPLSRRL